MLYHHVAKPILFRMDPETAHHWTIGGLSTIGQIPGGTGLLNMMYGVQETPELSMDLWGMRFPHPIGLAAGLDKNGQAIRAFSSIGFGFVEVGTVTPKPQPGNDLPRLFRLSQDEALINRMGFNNLGAEYLAKQLAHIQRLKQQRIPIAVNIGKNKLTSNETAMNDYIACIRILYPYGDFFVVNISSPNTPDLRKLQHGAELRQLLEAVTQEMEVQKEKYQRQLPILVKIAPDLVDDELEQVVETLSASRISGIIATNTTLSRDGLTHQNSRETGGMSGKPLAKRSTEVIRSIYKLTGGRMPIIGVGGIFTAEDAYEKIRAGASLIEIYTALIYRGPGVIREITNGLSQLLRRDGLKHVSEAVGIDS
ncbi:MAG: quinone-dependent dihydroorotate dehydrogenase [Paenibacillaceae bacterium]